MVGSSDSGDRRAVVVGVEFCAADPVVLELWKEMGCCRPQEIYVRDSSTLAPVFTLYDPACGSFSSTRTLCDAQDTPLLSTKSKACTWREQIDVYRGNQLGQSQALAFRIREAGCATAKLHVYLAGNDPGQKNPDYELRAAYFGESMTIFKQERVIAKVESNWSLCCCRRRPDYSIAVGAGVDQAFVVLLVAVQDEIKQRQQAASG